jgi:non-ribosomal peptide synthetase component F
MALEPTKLESISLLFFLGEALVTDLLTRFFRKNRTLYSFYGATETMMSSLYLFKAITDLPKTIGQACFNKQLYVLNENLTPCRAGVPGELYVSGEGVARGYLNQPKLTAERFIQNPFGPGRLYKTGDLVRWLPDGCLA